MLTRRTTRIPSILAICGVLASFGTAKAEPASQLPAAVYQQITNQEAALQAVHLDYTEKQEGPDLSDFYGGPTTYSTDLDGKFFYLRAEYQYKMDNGVRSPHEDAFDGKYFYYGDPRRADPNAPPLLARYSPFDSGDPDLKTTMIYFRYPEAAGWRPAETIAELQTYNGIKSLVLQLLSESDSTQIEEKAGDIHLTVQVPDPLVVMAQQMDLRRRRKDLQSWRNGPGFVAKEMDALTKMQAMVPKRIVKLVLDAKHGYEIRDREDVTPDGKRIMQAHSEDWKQFENGVWLPQRCVEQYFTDRFKLVDFSEQPRLLVNFDLKNVSFNVTNHNFALNYTKPGSLFVDHTGPQVEGKWDHQVMYTVAADGSLLLGTATNVAREMNPGRRYISIALLILLCGAPAIWFLVRQIKSSKAQ